MTWASKPALRPAPRGLRTVLSAISRGGAYVLIVAGWLLFTGLLPSAAGPADLATGLKPAPPAATSVPASPARLIARPSRDQLDTPAGSSTDASLPADERATPAPTEAPPAAPPPPLLPPTDRLSIPRIGLDVPIVDVGVLPSGEMETAAFAAGRLVYTAQAGEAGNIVLAGHNDILGEVFRRLPELQVQDEIVLYRGDAVFRYLVETRTIVREDGATEAQRRENAHWMDNTEEPVATLITCYPYRVDTHRVIVRARLQGTA